MIDYARMQRTHRVHKAALTRAKKRGAEAVVTACENAIREWDEIGAWPDDWAHWQRALDDIFPTFRAPTMDEIARTL